MYGVYGAIRFITTATNYKCNNDMVTLISYDKLQLFFELHSGTWHGEGRTAGVSLARVTLLECKFLVLSALPLFFLWEGYFTPFKGAEDWTV